MRTVQLVEGEYYHIFNRGVDKRIVFQDSRDFERFLLSMEEFNSVEPIGSIYEHSFQKNPQLGNRVSKLGVRKQKNKPLVEIIVYCLNKNHFHLILRQLAERGIEKFMHKLGLGFTKYFNERHERSGSLFQGPFKAVHIESNEQLIYVSGYVNLNNRVHGIKDANCYSSWPEYTGKIRNGICNKEIIIGQFKNLQSYIQMTEDTVEEIKKRRDEQKYADLLLE